MLPCNEFKMKLPQDWPPECAQVTEDVLLSNAIDWALGHSLVLRPNPPNQTCAIHGPFALYPTPFPRLVFDKVIQLQRAYNDLYMNIASDEAFLERVIGQVVAKVDDFQGGLWKIWKKVKEEGIAQELTLGLFRSDYLLHDVDDAIDARQVEFNTISSSFGPLANRVSDLHRYLAVSGGYDHTSISIDQIPDNHALRSLAAGLAAGHKAYGSESAVIMMVVQDPERNAFDQRALEWELLQTHGIRLVRKSFAQLADHILPMNEDKKLIISSHCPETLLEVSVVYFRSGYTPRDYPTQKEWDIRLTLERTKAIKCPSIALQLAGAKKVQQVLATESASLEQHLSPEFHKDADALRSTFMGIWPMDDHSEAGKEAQRLAASEYQRFVLKPQREGGGNNIYKANIPKALADMAVRDAEKVKRGDSQPQEKEGYILMELIKPPQELVNTIVRGGQAQATKGEIVSELGIFGTVLFNRDVGNHNTVLLNEQAGHLLRTKGSDDDEGGVAVGFSVIDSPLLI